MNTGGKLEQRVEHHDEFRSGPTVWAVFYCEERGGTERYVGRDLGEPVLTQSIVRISAEIKNGTMQGGKQH